MGDGKNLEVVFEKTAKGAGGVCPLPEPGESGTTIEHPQTMRMKIQPTGYDYDSRENSVERARYLQDLQKALKNGDITHDEFEQLKQM